MNKLKIHFFKQKNYEKLTIISFIVGYKFDFQFEKKKKNEENLISSKFSSLIDWPQLSCYLIAKIKCKTCTQINKLL